MERAEKWKKQLKENAVIAAVMAALWLILGWLRSFGVQSVLLWPLNYLTGALSGLDGGSVVGGAAGKALLMMALSSFLRPLLLKKGPLKVRLKAAENAFGLRLLRKLPGYIQFKQFAVKDPCLHGCALLGAGFAFVTYPFLTGNGSFQNSFVCLLLGFSLWKVLLRQKGLILALLNKALSRWGRNVNEKYVLQVIAGGSAGYALTAALSVFRAVELSMGLGTLCLAVGAVLLLAYVHKGKAVAA